MSKRKRREVVILLPPPVGHAWGDGAARSMVGRTKVLQTRKFGAQPVGRVTRAYVDKDGAIRAHVQVEGELGDWLARRNPGWTPPWTW